MLENLDNDIFSNTINIWISRWIDDIKDTFQRASDVGAANYFALAKAIDRSLFRFCPELFFKLAMPNSGEELITKTLERLEKLDETNDEKQNKIQIYKYKEEKRCTLDLCEAIREKYASILAIPLSTRGYGHYQDSWVSFDDTDPTVLPIETDNRVYSICTVKKLSGGMLKLIRHADIKADGQIERFIRDKSKAPKFYNRDRLILNDTSFEEGTRGVWSWKAKPSNNNPMNDFIIVDSEDQIDPIEIIRVEGAWNIEEILVHLKNGIYKIPHGNKTLFVCPTSQDQSVGILLARSQVIFEDGKCKINRKCDSVPVYYIKLYEVINIDNEYTVLNRIFAGPPAYIQLVKDKQEVARDALLSSLSWSWYKARGFVKEEYDKFRKFIENAPLIEVENQIQKTVLCTREEARSLLEETSRQLVSDITVTTYQDELIQMVFDSKPELKERMKNISKKKWEEENAEIRANAFRELNNVKMQIYSKEVNLEKLEIEQRNLQVQNAELSKMIEENLEIADEVEEALKERIQNAKSNLGELIVDILFQNQISLQTTKEKANSRVSEMNTNKTPKYCFGSNLGWQTDSKDIYHNWDDVLAAGECVLKSAGVSKDFSSGLATFLSAAFLIKQPVLMVGPNALEIAQAIAGIMGGDSVGVLNCSGDFDPILASTIGSENEEVVIIKNLFSSGWINNLPDLLTKKDIFYIIIHPFTKDILVETSDIFEYMLPLFTEFFVESRSSNEYRSGSFAQDFKLLDCSDEQEEIRPLISKIYPNRIIGNCIKKMIEIMRCLGSDSNVDDELMFCTIPLAYGIGKIQSLSDLLDKPSVKKQISPNFLSFAKNLVEDSDV